MALVGAADRVAAVAAAVDDHLRVAVVVADGDDAVFADEGHEEIAGVGDLAVVAHEVPCAREDLLQLELIDVLVAEDAPVDEAVTGLDHAAHSRCSLNVDGHGNRLA